VNACGRRPDQTRRCPGITIFVCYSVYGFTLPFSYPRPSGIIPWVPETGFLFMFLLGIHR